MASGGTDLSNQAEDNAFSPRIVPKPPMKSSDNLLKVRLVIGCDITVSNHEVNQSYFFRCSTLLSPQCSIAT